jgi:hypothetical protein
MSNSQIPIHIDGNVFLQFLGQLVSAAQYYPAVGDKPDCHFCLSLGIIFDSAIIRSEEFHLGFTRMKLGVSNGSYIAVRGHHVRVPSSRRIVNKK